MRSIAIWGLMMALGGVGCASTQIEARSANDVESDASWTDSPSMHVGQARVMDTRVNPLAPIGLASKGGAVTLIYGRPRARTVARIDAGSLRPVSSEREGVTAVQPDGATDHATAADAPARVLLDGGRVVLVWKQGNAEWGYRALAQEFAADGTPVALPVVISPPDVDVMGSPKAVTTDGSHVVATFTGASESAFQLIAVPLEIDSPAGTDRLARK